MTDSACLCVCALVQKSACRACERVCSGVYALALHPDLDLLCSGGRDAVVRVWDLRTKQQVYALSGHTGTVMALEMQTAMPHIVSGSQDKMVRIEDSRRG